MNASQEVPRPAEDGDWEKDTAELRNRVEQPIRQHAGGILNRNVNTEWAHPESNITSPESLRNDEGGARVPKGEGTAQAIFERISHVRMEPSLREGPKVPPRRKSTRNPYGRVKT